MIRLSTKSYETRRTLRRIWATSVDRHKPVVFSNPISVSDMAKGNPGGVCGHAAPG